MGDVIDSCDSSSSIIMLLILSYFLFSVSIGTPDIIYLFMVSFGELEYDLAIYSNLSISFSLVLSDLLNALL